MIAVLVVLSVILPTTCWFLFGSPDLNNSANLLFFTIFVLHICAVIWQGKLFKLFGGDGFTYGAVGLGINIWSLAYTFVMVFGLFHRVAFFQLIWGEDFYKDAQHVPKILVGFLLLGLLLTIAIPLLTTRHVTPLSKKSDRREFDTPGDGG
jgi:uncharacterized membrane protein (UPF0182 family)